MQDHAEILMSEISQLREQYRAEVGAGRRVWPRSIKERVEKLDAMGITAKQVSLQTGIGYETILQWRFKRRQRVKRQFHEVSIALEPKVLAKIDAVTVPKFSTEKEIFKIGTVTVTTPEGFKIETSDVRMVVELLKELRRP
jgi:hypothetical protein